MSTTRHQDGSPGVWGCEGFESRAECPHCARYEACLALDDVQTHIKAIVQQQPESFSQAEAEALRSAVAAVARSLGRLNLKRRAA